MKTEECQLDWETVTLILSILAKGDRVELIPVKDGVKVIRIHRKEMKIESKPCF